MPAGAAIVAATALLAVAAPGRLLLRLFATIRLGALPRAPGWLPVATSLAALALLVALLWTGLRGPRDPLANLLPLVVWTLFWVALPLAQAVLGDLWAWINPWTGLARLLRRGRPAPLRLPDAVGVAPALLAWILFALFLLAGIAPDDPARLAAAVILYSCWTLIGLLLFGEDWMRRGECFGLMLGLLARLAPVGRAEDGIRAGLPGWRVAAGGRAAAGTGVFLLAVLAAGSFDGLNETFWWLDLIGVNPLEFPGRSAVQGETAAGLLAAMVLLVLAFALTVRAGLALAGAPGLFGRAFGPFALAAVPIALGYHAAHYLTTFLVNVQFLAGALTDPFRSGADLLGLGHFHPTTSFLYDPGSVRVIWLAQAGAIVLGHVLAILLAHRVALALLGTTRAAALSQLPVAVFMTLYTLLGLSILAAPTGA